MAKKQVPSLAELGASLGSINSKKQNAVSNTKTTVPAGHGINQQQLLEARGALKKVVPSAAEAGNASRTDPLNVQLPQSTNLSEIPRQSSQKPPRAVRPQGWVQSFESAQTDINKFVKGAGKGYLPRQLIDIEKQIEKSQSAITESFTNLRSSPRAIKDSIQDLTQLLDKLDNFTDLKVGIIRTTHENQIEHIGSSKKSSVILRDARDQIELQKHSKATHTKTIRDKKEDVPESTVTIITGQARGILKLIEMDNSITLTEKTNLQREVLKSLQSYSTAIGSMSSQEARTKMTRAFNTNMGHLLRKSGMEINGVSGDKIKRTDLERVMVYARDFTNFEAKDSPGIVTITSNIANDKANPLYEVAASIPLKPVGKELAKYYENLPNQAWFKNLSKIEQAFVEEYKDKIIGGNHMIPTQLRELVGIKNGYLEQTSVIDDEGTTKDSAILVRSATLAHNLGSGPDSLNITKQNMLHVKNLSGGRELSIDTLNHNLGAMLSSISADIRVERDIQKTMKVAAQSFESHGEGIKFNNHPISISMSKTDNIMNASGIYIKNNLAGANTSDPKKKKILCVSCKSGKDRTGLIAHESTMSWLDGKFSSLLTRDANEITAKASHQEELAARNTKGIFGLKVKTVLYGLRTKALGWRKITHIGTIGNLFRNQISYNNAVHLDLKDHTPNFFSRIKGRIQQMIQR